MKNTNMTLSQLKRALKTNFEKTKIEVKRNTVFLNNFGAMEQEKYNY